MKINRKFKDIFRIEMYFYKYIKNYFFKVSDEDELENLSFERSIMNNEDFPLSTSFNNMYKKNGLHIEEGQIGR